jgi:hypothetical protein
MSDHRETMQTMSKRDSYDRWNRPAFGRLHTRRAMPHDNSAIFDLPREGTGNYVRPVVSPSGCRGEALKGSGDHRLEAGENVNFEPIRNGMPEFVPYEYRTDRWQQRVARSGLDLDAIRAADRELAQAASDRDHARTRPGSARRGLRWEASI